MSGARVMVCGRGVDVDCGLLARRGETCSVDGVWTAWTADSQWPYGDEHRTSHTLKWLASTLRLA